MTKYVIDLPDGTTAWRRKGSIIAIAGVAPVELLSTLGEPEVRRGETIRALLYADPSGEYEYYTTKKVREILIKFANSKNAMWRDMTAEHIVDEFMESSE